MNARRRLERLEAQGATTQADERATVSREVLRRLSDPELEAYVGALRCLKAQSAPLGEDWAIRDRVTQLYEEVRNEQAIAY